MIKCIAITLGVLLASSAQAELMELQDAEMASVHGQQQSEGASPEMEEGVDMPTVTSQGDVPMPLVMAEALPEVQKSGISIEVSFLLSIGNIEYTDPDGWQGHRF